VILRSGAFIGLDRTRCALPVFVRADSIVSLCEVHDLKSTTAESFSYTEVSLTGPGNYTHVSNRMADILAALNRL
jgi:hypothetical protein